MSEGVVISQQGEAAVRVQFTELEPHDKWSHIHSFARRLRDLGLPSLHGVAATYDSALVEFDPLRLSGGDVEALLRREASLVEAASSQEVATSGRHFRIPACYEPDFGPDLQMVAALFELGIDELCALHADQLHRIRAYGAPAAAPLMDGLGQGVSVPRRESPRVRVPGGSLALAGQQSIIYSVPAPGGWQLIGRTPVELARPRDVVCTYRPGDQISYFSIASSDWDRYVGRPMEEFSV